MTHSLLTSYELLDHMDVFVRPPLFAVWLLTILTSVLAAPSFVHLHQRPSRATHDQLTRFHTDEYVDFLSQVTPETVEELTGSGSRCVSPHLSHPFWPVQD